MTGRCTSLPRGSLLAVALLCALPLFPQSRPADLRSLVEAEKSFAALSAREGVKEAFLKYLADDAIVFRPHPVNGREVWVSRPSPTFLLSWYPSHAEVSADGSLGFTTGPSVFTDTTHGSRLDQHGHFVTVWKRGADSVWKVALDAGIGHAEILPPPPVFNPEEVMTESSAAGPLPGTWSDTVLALERSCGEIAAKHGLSAVYARYARSDIRIYREGRAPSVGVPPVDSISDKLGGRLEPLSARSAGSGDMAYTYGKFSRGSGEMKEEAYYVRVWRAERGKGWNIALELWIPLSLRKQ